MNGKSMCAALALGAALSVANGAAGQMAVTPEVALNFLDADKDGKVTLNDYLNVQLPKMAANDADQNGELSYKEFKETLEPRAKANAEQSFNAFNREGRARTMNQREFLGYHAYVFGNVLDGNKDGVLSAEELGKIMKRDK
jgi:Ca2+-binding EF-hand superfamily protein